MQAMARIAATEVDGIGSDDCATTPQQHLCDTGFGDYVRLLTLSPFYLTDAQPLTP